MVSEQKFVPHESSSETVHTKVEKPSGRIRGSGSPFRCISSLVQQMNSEKDHEISLARQRIEELEALLSNKQKEVILLACVFIIFRQINWQWSFVIIYF
jgi:kinesin family protein 15